MEGEKDVKALAESEMIDRQVEEIMAEDEAGSGAGAGKKKKKRKKKAVSGGKLPLKERWKSYSRRRKVVTILGVLAVAAVVLSRCGGGKDGPAAMPVSVMSLTRQPIKEKLSVSGPVSGTDSVDVVSNIHAEIMLSLIHILRMISATFIFSPFTLVGTPPSKVMVTYSPSSGAFSGRTPRTSRWS